MYAISKILRDFGKGLIAVLPFGLLTLLCKTDILILYNKNKGDQSMEATSTMTAVDLRTLWNEMNSETMSVGCRKDTWDDDWDDDCCCCVGGFSK